ncbi:acyl-CoA dehydrogenase family protein [Nocardioides albus]|uniref:Alkylation response protein AidB-like acyl-CoA dehydrogenase n=1 Tax=Nocardioides albus TaxID=1841 RepID=A0A7W5F8J3_9ACTN|nr:acyl-CoA dehydrogenase family protein [Nocardioides albus]MBB3088992.1 alkylation response protein AidB-like acyl-CoA dehydrogenase [Nocardioides albus]GGU14953.1 acyl-CoA dehydrogenase [Nocardioides albus]
MRFSFTQEQDDLRHFVRDFLSTHAGQGQRQRISRDGYVFDPGLWRQLAEQLGLTGLTIDEEHGGSGAGTLEAAIVLEEMGREMYAGPYLSTFLGTHLLGLAPKEVQAELLPDVSSGSRILTVALREEQGSWEAPGTSTRAEATASGGWVLSGEKRFVTDVATATTLLVRARTVDGPAWFAVDQDTDGVEARAAEGLDLAREIGHLSLTRAPGRMVIAPADADAAHQHLLDSASVALAAELVGLAGACLDQSVAWSKDRDQFGRPIGSFQAVKHHCANTLVELETARMLARYAAFALGAGTPDASAAASMAKQAAADAAYQASGSNIQIHGGIGFTWEHHAHLYLRRAKADAALFEDAAAHRARVADLLHI